MFLKFAEIRFEMTPFLKQTARHYIGRPNVENCVFIFPNKRPVAFFRKYLRECLAETAGGRPMLSPLMLTVNDFFSQVTGMAVADRITLLVMLYDCYRSLNPEAGTLDDFISQGETILSDFDEVDKYRVDAKMLFADIADIRSIQNDMSWVSQEQKEAIETLAGHFTAGKLTAQGGVKSRFLATWKLLMPMYGMFRDKLAADGLAYEGMAYRSFADRLEKEPAADILASAFPGASKFVFIGFNAVNRCEEAVMTKMQKAGIAEFCWDYCGGMTPDPGNDSSFFLADYSTRFGNAFNVEGGGVPDIRVISVPSAAGQAELLEKVIGGCSGEGPSDWLDYAVVLPDETMLGTVLNNIPSNVDAVNVTMGYPLSASEFFYFLRSLAALQMHVRRSGGRCSFYYRQVYDLLSGTILKSVMGEEEMAAAADVRKAARPYVPVEDLARTPLFGTVFRAAEQESGQFADWLLEVTAAVARRLPEEDALQTECARMCYKCISRLRDMKLDILPKTFAKLAVRLASGLSVPFDGEPLGGLQIMGPLETRALDFRHVIILSASEGVFPHIASGLSMIPMDVRAGFGLPTTKYQDAVWSYYFYRLITRAETVTLLYDSRSEGLASGEESRYIKQLRYIFQKRGLCTLREFVAAARVSTAVADEAIPKTKEDIDAIRSSCFSASSLQNYLACPVRFYYSSVKRLRADDDVKDSLDAGTLGTVCHETLQFLYGGRDAVDAGYLESWLTPERRQVIKQKIDSLICSKIHCDEVTGPDLLDARLALQFVTKVLRRDIELIRARGPLRILGLEKEYDRVELFPGFLFKGYVDRLDTFGDGTVRVVDYKSGSDDPEALKLLAEGASAIESRGLAKIDKAVLQFYIYDRFVAQDKEFLGKARANSMYAMGDIFRNPVAVNGESPASADVMGRLLEELLKQIVDTEVPFIRTSDSQKCKYCDYCSLCGVKKEN